MYQWCTDWNQVSIVITLLPVWVSTCVIFALKSKIQCHCGDLLIWKDICDVMGICEEMAKWSFFLFRIICVYFNKHGRLWVEIPIFLGNLI